MPIKRQPSALALALERRKREALAGSRGRCECPIEKHEWHQGMLCGRELSDPYYYLTGLKSHLALWLFAMIAIVKFRLPMNGYISKIFDTYVGITLKQRAFLSLLFSNFMPPIVATSVRFWE